MKINNTYIEEKIDPYLKEALSNLQEDEIVRVIMVLGPESKDTKQDEISKKIDPSQFNSREAYRKALIDQRQSEISRDIGSIRQALTELSLVVHSAGFSKVVVVDGTVRQIKAALELPGVYHASLDQPIKLIRPRSQKS